MNIETIPSITLSIPDLYSLLYSYDQFFGQRPVHLSPHDRPLFPIRIVPVPIGTLIRDADPEEKFFHVEFTPHQAEVWNSKAWTDSLTRRLRIAGSTVAEQQSPIEAAHSALTSRLIHYFSRNCHMRLAHSAALTEYLLSGPDNPTLLQMAALPIDIAHSLQSYRESIYNATRPETSTACPGSSVQPDAQGPV